MNKNFIKLPSEFTKLLEEFWFFELNYSITFNKWLTAGKELRVKKFKKLDLYPQEINRIVNIYRCLSSYYQKEVPIKERFQTSIDIYTKHGQAIRAAMSKVYLKMTMKNKLPIPDRDNAMSEMKARGFRSFFKTNIRLDFPYVGSIDNQLVWPYQVFEKRSNWGGVYDLQALVGVRGFTKVYVNDKKAHDFARYVQKLHDDRYDFSSSITYPRRPEKNEHLIKKA